MVAGHVTAHLLGCWHAGKIWGCVTILALSLDGVGISQYCQSINCFDGLVGRYSLV